MPRGLHRYQQCGDLHFLTFSCYHRLPYLKGSEAACLFESALEAVRKRYGLAVLGYVVMPEHIHMLVNEPKRGRLDRHLQRHVRGPLDTFLQLVSLYGGIYQLWRLHQLRQRWKRPTPTTNTSIKGGWPRSEEASIREQLGVPGLDFETWESYEPPLAPDRRRVSSQL